MRAPPLCGRYKRIFEHKHILHACPPPLNMPVVLVDIIRHRLGRLGRHRCLAWLSCCRSCQPSAAADEQEQLAVQSHDKIDGRQLMADYMKVWARNV